MTDYTNIVISLEGNGTRESHRGDGYHEDDSMYTLNTVEQHSVCYSVDGYAQYANKPPILRASGGDNGGGQKPLLSRNYRSDYCDRLQGNTKCECAEYGGNKK